MKLLVLSLTFFFTILSVNAQDKKEIAKVYYKKALISFKENDLAKTERYLEKTVFYNGGISNKEIANFGAKFYFKNKKFSKAKEYLTAYFKLEKNKKADNYTDMLVLYTDTIDAIASDAKPIKETKKVVPIVVPVVKTDVVKKTIKEKTIVKENITVKGKTVIKEIENNSESDEGSNSVNENSTTRELVDNGVVKNVPFSIIENAPVYPGCSGTRGQIRDCFNKNIQYHFSRKFNADLPNKLGLSVGRKRILIGFTIKQSGFVEDVTVRAPHVALKNEVLRVMKLLPRIKPGTQRGKNVNVKYSFPLNIIVE